MTHQEAQRKIMPQLASVHTAVAGGQELVEQVADVEARNFHFYYGSFKALDDISLAAPRHQITALIGPSGCGKSTLLRAMNRMHDRTPGARPEGQLLLQGKTLTQ